MRAAIWRPVFGDVIMIGTVENETNSGNPYEVLKEDELLNKLNVSRKHAERGMVRNVEEVIMDMRKKYKLENCDE